MSQKVIFVTVDGWVVPEVFHTIPDYEEACQICLDNGWDGRFNDGFDFYNVNYEWYDIGEGESGTDEFIDDETLLQMYDDEDKDFKELVKERFGLEVNCIDTGDLVVRYEDLREDDMEEDE